MIYRLLFLAFLMRLSQVTLLAQTYQKELPTLFKQCTQTRLDSAHRLIVAFLRKHEVVFSRKPNLVETPKKFYAFCKDFKALCLEKNHLLLLHRVQIIELIDRLKFQKATPEQAKKAFEKLFDELVSAKDYSAALSCLLESSLGFYPTQVERLKVLFFAEKFAERHQLQKDIALQSIQHMIGFYLWELNMHALSSQYFQKSLKTGYSIPSDSLRALNGLGINYQKIGDFKTSNEYFEKASRYALHIKNHLFNTVIEGNKAVNFFRLGELEKAYTYALRYKNISLQHELWENAFGAVYWLVQIELERKHPEKAKVFLDSLAPLKAKVTLKENALLIEMRLKEARYLYEKALQNPTKTLLAYQAYIKADSTFQIFAHKSSISEAKLKAEVDLYAQEMVQKEQERRTSVWFLGTVVGCLLVFMVLLVAYFYQRGKRHKHEIEHLRQQLYAQIQTINEKNEDIQPFLPKETEAQETESLEFDTAHIEAKEEDIQHLRNFNLAYKEQWGNFRESFLKVYPAFERNLVEKIGAVSNAELRLLMLHKLGLDNNEIAQSLLISPYSVRTGKYRLYKKIGISSIEELDRLL